MSHDQNHHQKVVSSVSRGPLFAAALIAASLLGACAGNPPREEMAVGRAAVERASGPAASESPMELSTARDKIARANVAMAEKDYKTARRLAEEAEADAALAEARARETRADRALGEVRESIRALRAELNKRS